MHDIRPAPAPRDWHDALAALPLETPPPGGWQAMAARLDARRRRRIPVWAAASAAALVLALVLPWRLQQPQRPAPAEEAQLQSASAAIDDERLEALYAQSAELEALLGLARDERMSSGTAALISEALDEQLARIDLALIQPGLAQDERLRLWQRRVEGLRAATGFEGNQRWLAAQGSRYDAALVFVD